MTIMYDRDCKGVGILDHVDQATFAWIQITRLHNFVKILVLLMLPLITSKPNYLSDW